MKPTTPQFTTAAEVREFMGGDAYAKTFAHCTNKLRNQLKRIGYSK